MLNNHALHKYTESHGGEIIELIDLYDLEGNLLISGIEEIENNDSQRNKLILKFSSKFQSKWIENFRTTNKAPINNYFEYGKTKIDCEIGRYGDVLRWIKK